jgi:hypothetical protein
MGRQVGESAACYFPVAGEGVAALIVDGLPPIVNDHRVHTHIGSQRELGVELLLLQLLVHPVRGGVHRLVAAAGRCLGSESAPSSGSRSDHQAAMSASTSS